MDWLKEYKNRDNKTFSQIFSMIEEGLDNNFIIKEQKDSAGKKFMMVIPKMSPSEIWGDPNSLDRKQVDSIFRVVRGGSNIAARIEYLNNFLSVESATRKRSPRVIINTMMIVESLKAALNHFNESSAGFVFEAFMAALTGGFQQAGRVGGTLPIEDFVAFSQFGGQNVPVSLKLLGKNTGIKGSFTNLVDYLFVRGEDSIKYLIAYKTKDGENVGKLEIYDFDITKENLVDFISGGTRTTKNLFSPVPFNTAKKVVSSGDPEKIAALFKKASGYTNKGMLHKAPKEEEPPQDTVSETFHINENRSLLTEATDTQWEISFTMMKTLSDKINLQSHGSLDFSEARMNQLAEIYGKKLGDTILNLLESTQDLTNNIGAYFSQKNRSKAMNAGRQAQNDAEAIQNNLSEQLTSDDEENT